MNVKDSYDLWAEHYDKDPNKTRDLEARALRHMLSNSRFDSCLEIGCGTGKNTTWLANRSNKLLAVDLSEKMLKKAQAKVSDRHVVFKQADIRGNWGFVQQKFDLVVFSLVLEHIHRLEPIIERAAETLQSGGVIYIGELHPYKQYKGTSARFKTGQELRKIECFTHHISEFAAAGRKAGLRLDQLDEFFDNSNSSKIPRIIAMTFRKG